MAAAILPSEVAAQAHRPKAIPSGKVIEWGLEKGGYGATYNSGELTIRVTVAPKPTKEEAADPYGAGGDKARTPVLTVSAPGRQPLRVAGVEGSSAGTTWFGVGKLDPEAPGEQIIFAAYSFGAHCCTRYKVIEEDPKGPGWKVLDLGDFDGDPLPRFPKDIDGDGVPDLVFWDNSFNYAFCGYACSAPYAPPLVLEIRGGQVWETSSAARHRRLFEGKLKYAQDDCVKEHANGACAGFVAMAARLGRREWAWNRMLKGYSRSEAEWLPQGCSAHLRAGNCPKGKEIKFKGFQPSLEAFLVQHGYMKASEAKFATSIPSDPSFRCDERLTPAKRTICNTRALRIADLDLAYVFLDVLANGVNPEALQREQIEWLARRDASPADVQALLALYAERTKTLEAAAASTSGSSAQPHH